MSIVIDGNYVNSTVANTEMLEKVRDGLVCAYAIIPVEGYVLRDNTGDWSETDRETGKEVVHKAYYSRPVTCGANYDFDKNPREFRAVKKRG